MKSTCPTSEPWHSQFLQGLKKSRCSGSGEPTARWITPYKATVEACWESIYWPLNHVANPIQRASSQRENPALSQALIETITLLHFVAAPRCCAGELTLSISSHRKLYYFAKMLPSIVINHYSKNEAKFSLTHTQWKSLLEARGKGYCPNPQVWGRTRPREVRPCRNEPVHNHNDQTK